MKLEDKDDLGPPRDYVGYGRRGSTTNHWPAGKTVALNIAISYEEGSEKSKVLGDSENEGMVDLCGGFPHSERDLAVESQYEYGSRAGVWRLARLFDRMHVPVTFFAAAVALERNPEVGAWLAESGNDVCAHGWRWEKPYTLTREQEAERIQFAIDSITQTCGAPPAGWYCRYGPSVNTRQLLVENGSFLYDSDSYSDDVPYFTTVAGIKHLVIPYSQLINDGKFVRGTGFSAPEDFTNYAARNLEYLVREQRPVMMSVGLHPRIMGHPARTWALEKFIEYAQSIPEVWITRRLDIAHAWLNSSKEAGAAS